MTGSTFTRDGDRVEIRLGRGAWTHEFDWVLDDDGPPSWTEIPGGNGMAVRYTVRLDDVTEPDDIHRLNRYRLEANESGAQHHGPHAVVVLTDVVMSTYKLGEPEYLRETAEDSIRVSHHWVAALLMVSGPMEWTESVHLFARNADKPIACLACPPLSRVTP
jgi:hypothetical protein